jgi:pyruvate,orthophosphate dikinase
MEIKNLAQQYIYWPELENKYQTNIDMSKVTLGELTPLFKTYAEKGKTSVTDSIITFYGLNETLARVRQEGNDVLEVKTLDLYKTYFTEIEDLSQKMFSYVFMISMMEARHCRDFKKVKEHNENFRYEREYENASYDEQEKMKEGWPEKLGKFKDQLVQEYVTNKPGGITVDPAKFRLFFDLVENISNIESYTRDQVQSDFIPLLSQDPYSALTIGDALECAEVMFTQNNFRSSFGGKPWANIAEHAKKFAKGDINAEVFIDQAFSLEHNGGQIFNKDIIFKGVNANDWYTGELKGMFDRNVNSYTMLDTQVCLNAQHQGQLLSWLKCDYSQSVHNVIYGVTYETAKKAGVIPEEFTASQYENAQEYIKTNMRNLQSIFGQFKEDHPELIKSLEAVSINLPPADIYTTLNQVMRGNGNGKLKIPDNHKGFHKLSNYLITKGTRKNKFDEEIEKPYNFSFDYLDTKAVPVEKMKKELLGNKAFGLAQMHEINLPVPNALVFPATNAGSFYKDKAKWIAALRPELNKVTDFFKDKDGNPIACSVRSGSAISMPGMMDTILNVGIDNSNYNYFCKKMGKEVVNECVTKFMSLFCKSLLGEEVKFSGHFSKALFQFRDVLSKHKIPQDFNGIFPLNARQQYKWCLQAVFSSWHSERANAYREHQGVSHDIGTAAIVQQMVFGNLNEKSCTGVVFSRDCISGEKGIIGEFLPQAQGEDVVSGAVTPKNIKEMEAFNPEAYAKLLEICERLEKDTGDIQDIEFTIEDGDLYILQKRKAVCSSLAQAKLNQELYELGLIDKEHMLKSIKLDSLISKDVVDTTGAKVEGKGLVGNPGVIRGIVVRNEKEMEEYREIYELNKRDTNYGWIFYAPETSPEHAPIMLKTQAFITSNGGFTSHAAILARSWDKPCVVGMGDLDNPLLKSGSLVTIYANILPLKESNNQEIKSIVDNILEHYQVNIDEIAKDNPFEEIVQSVNSMPSWMEKYKAAHRVAEEKAGNVKLNKFINLGQKVALMIVKAQEQEMKSAAEIVRVNKAQQAVEATKEINVNETIKVMPNIEKNVTKTVSNPRNYGGYGGYASSVNDSMCTDFLIAAKELKEELGLHYTQPQEKILVAVDMPLSFGGIPKMSKEKISGYPDASIKTVHEIIKDFSDVYPIEAGMRVDLTDSPKEKIKMK